MASTRKRQIHQQWAASRSKLAKGGLGLYARLLRTYVTTNTHHLSNSSELLSLIRGKSWGKLLLVADSMSEQSYSDATMHLVANQFSLLVKKYPWPPKVLNLKPRETAIRKFMASEKRCGLMNRKFRLLQNDPGRDRLREQAVRARVFIRSLLGARPDYAFVFRNGDFGSGASLGVHGNATHWVRKVSESEWTCTPGALHSGFGVVLNNRHLLERFLPLERLSDGREFFIEDYDEAFKSYVASLQFVEHNKIDFVPKTAKTHRSIAIEPLVNGLVQKGLDELLRKKLRKFGIDLSDQAPNQEMAFYGSVTDDMPNGYVTLDLSSASDSVSTELVRYLLPEDWFRYLSGIRSARYQLDGGLRDYNKFCSMGNGFCFPLETLIFVAACVACDCGVVIEDFRVYGDDIIVRKSKAADVIALLHHWGFALNQHKSFLDGPFRESCGADYFGGVDVRPFTLDYALTSVEAIFKTLNLWQSKESWQQLFRGCRELLIKELPELLRLYRPLPGDVETGIDSSGDEHLTCATCHFDNGRWHWWELKRIPVDDIDRLRFGNGHLAMGAALRGAASQNRAGFGQVRMTLRRVLRTRVARESYASVSNWLPLYDIRVS